MRIIKLIIIALLLMQATTATADTIANRFGFTGRVGFALPENVGDTQFINGNTETKSNVAWNLGCIYGFNDNLASELEVSILPRLDVEVAGIKAYETKLTDFALGLQYRFTPKNQLVPYIGAGIDAMKGSMKHVNGNSYDLDWTYGGHVKVGLDWFLTKGIALTADLRGVVATSGDINKGSTKVNEYDPLWVQGTIGLRLILPEKW